MLVQMDCLLCRIFLMGQRQSQSRFSKAETKDTSLAFGTPKDNGPTLGNDNLLRHKETEACTIWSGL